MATDKEKRFINKCYNAYCHDWMMEKGITVSDIIRETVLIVNEFDRDEEITAGAVEQEFLDAGFGGSLFVCRDEFLGAEFMDRDYMKYLLSMMYYGDTLKQMEMEELWENITGLAMNDEDSGDSDE